MLLYLKTNSEEGPWYGWKYYKTEKAAYDAAFSLFNGEAWSPDWFKKDLIKIVDNGHTTFYSPKTFNLDYIELTMVPWIRAV